MEGMEQGGMREGIGALIFIAFCIFAAVYVYHGFMETLVKP